MIDHVKIQTEQQNQNAGLQNNLQQNRDAVLQNQNAGLQNNLQQNRDAGLQNNRPQAAEPQTKLEKLKVEKEQLYEKAVTARNEATELYNLMKDVELQIKEDNKRQASADEEENKAFQNYKERMKNILDDITKQFAAKVGVYIGSMLSISDKIEEGEIEFIRESGLEISGAVLDEAKRNKCERNIKMDDEIKELWPKRIKNKNRKVLESELQQVEERIALRKKLTGKAKSIAKTASECRKTYKNGYVSLSDEDLIDVCLFRAETVFSGYGPTSYLSEKMILEDMEFTFTSLDCYKEMARRINRKGFVIPQDKKKELKDALNKLSYYKFHVDVILSGYGMSTDNISYNEKEIEDIVWGRADSVRSYYKSLDYMEYVKRVDANKEIMYEPETAEEMLHYLEVQAGLTLDEVNYMGTSVFDDETASAFLDKNEQQNEQVQQAQQAQQNQQIRQDQISYVRYDKNILDQTGDFQNSLSKEMRIRMVCRGLCENLRVEGFLDEDKMFEELPHMMDQYLSTYVNHDIGENEEYAEKTLEMKEKIIKRLKQIEMSDCSFLEKQYAEMIRKYFDILSRGGLRNIHMQMNDQHYRVKDAEFADAGKKQANKLKYEFKSVKDMPLFEHEPMLKDISQGELGDCYLLAALASLVAGNPKYIYNMMRDNGNGTVTVRFYATDKITGTTRVRNECRYVTVEKSVPKYKSKSPYAKGALWVKMIEKAYAVVRNRDAQVDEKNKVIVYDNIDGGTFATAYRHLTGNEARSEMFDNNELYGFKNRLIGKNKPASVYFVSEHTKQGDGMDAAGYLVGRSGIGSQKKREYRAELDKYTAVENMLEKLMVSYEGDEQIRAMDNENFIEALERTKTKIIEAMQKLQDKNGQEVLDDELKTAGIPKTLYSPFKECRDLYERDVNVLSRTIAGILDAFIDKMRSELDIAPQYTQSEMKMYNRIQRALKEKKHCGIGSGDEGQKEAYHNGLYANHQYAVLGLEKHKIGNREKLFLRIMNPHGSNIPVYVKDENNKLKRAGFREMRKKDIHYGEYEEATNGVCLVELRDARSLFKDYDYGL